MPRSQNPTFYLQNKQYGNLIIRKIIKFVATICQILRLEWIKFKFGWGSAPDPAGGAYSAPQTLQLDLRGPTSKGGSGGVRSRQEGRGRDRRKGDGRPPDFELATGLHRDVIVH